MAHKYMMEDIYDEYKSLYRFSKQTYKQKMFTCVPAEFVLDPHPPQYEDFKKTEISQLVVEVGLEPTINTV